jgi:hypothetical protein
MKKPFYLLILGFALVTLAGGCIEYEVLGDNEGEENQLDAEPMIVTESDLPTETSTSTDEAIIGGDRDSHGCLAGAGYAYCPSMEKCVRDFEEDCEELDENGLTQVFDTDDENLAASGTIAYIKASDHYKQNNGSQIYITKFEAQNGTGSYTVSVNYKANVDNKVLRMTATLTMEDWNITDSTLVETPIQNRTANECVDADGRVVDTMQDGACKNLEAYIGNISDREEPNICCK